MIDKAISIFAVSALLVVLAAFTFLVIVGSGKV